MKLKTLLLLIMILGFLVTQIGCGNKAPPVPPPKPPVESETNG